MFISPWPRNHVFSYCSQTELRQQEPIPEHAQSLSLSLSPALWMTGYNKVNSSKINHANNSVAESHRLIKSQNVNWHPYTTAIVVHSLLSIVKLEFCFQWPHSQSVKQTIKIKACWSVQIKDCSKTFQRWWYFGSVIHCSSFHPWTRSQA